MAKSEKPFHKIMLVRTKLGMYAEYGDAAHNGQTTQEFVEDVRECFEYLMEFRNIINGMVPLDEAPSYAVIPYLSRDAVQAAADIDADQEGDEA